MNERGEKSGFIREIIGCLISPRSSFEAILEKPSLMKATAIIIVIAIVAAWASLTYTGKLPLSYLNEQRPEWLFPRQGNPVNPEQLRQASMIVNATIGLVSVFGTWLISSALIHGFSRTLRGNGSFRSMLTLAGYASIPLLIQQVLRLAYSFMVSEEEVIQLATSLQISAYPLLNRIANAAVDTFTIFRIWSIALLIIATRENFKMSTTKSTAAVVLSLIAIVFVSAFLPLR